MLAVVASLFFYKNIARHLLRNFADNHYKYKANFLWGFPTNLEYLIRVKRKLIARRRKKKGALHIFINIVYFLIFADKS